MTLEAAIAAEVAKALAVAARAPSPEDWLPHPTWPFPRKRGAWLASTGKIAARLDGRTWYARRCDVDAYMRTLPTAAPVRDERPMSVADMARAAARRSKGRRAA